MTLDEVKHLAESLMEKFGLPKRGWTFIIDFQTKHRRLGQCRFHKKQIGISAWYAETAKPETVEDTIRHEIAHALAGIEFAEYGHGPAWVAMCKRTGAAPERIKLSMDIPTRARFRATCGKCGHVYEKHTVKFRPGKSYYCRLCPPGSTTALQWESLKAEYAKEAAERAGTRVSDVLMGHIDEVQKLVVTLGSCEDKQAAKKIRARLRKLGHRGGLS